MKSSSNYNYMDKEQLAKAIVKAIAYTENGGKPDIKKLSAGKTGEMKSVFQFTPATWKQYSKEILGKDTPIHPDTETYVVNEKVKKWLDQGYKPEQIASMWNAGPGEPNAYSGKFSNGQKSAGINPKYGVRFDVPSYAKKVKNHFEQFLAQETRNPNATAESTPQTIKPIPQVAEVPLQMRKTPVEQNPGTEIYNKVMSVLQGGQAPKSTAKGGLLQQAIDQKNA